MRPRVGFARALVVHPNIMLMAEPFSALDVLTAETLRTDFLALWAEGRMPIKSVVLVTHNIEEAGLICDRIVVFGDAMASKAISPMCWVPNLMIAGSSASASAIAFAVTA